MLSTCAVIVLSLNGLIEGQFSGPNIALSKPASQFPGDYCSNNRCYDASLAVDGLLDRTSDLEGHCTHTSEQTTSKAFWAVNFTNFYHITGIVVFNRLAFESRLRNFSVYGIYAKQDTEQTAIFTYDSNNYPKRIEIELPNAPYVTGIRIEIPQRAAPEFTLLTLCEVEVYSDHACKPLLTGSFVNVSYTDSLNNGSIASFTCFDGYYLTGNRSLACQVYRWSEQPPECLRVYCPFPLSIQDGEYTISSPCVSLLSNSGLPYECTIRPICHNGYLLNQGRIRSCLNTGQWSEDEPICLIVMCRLPIKQNGGYLFLNGTVVTDDYIYFGQQIQLVCKAGYVVTTETGTLNNSCQQDGTLSGNESECTMVTCPLLEVLANVAYTYSHKAQDKYVPYNSTVTITCPNGILREGSEIRRCTEDGTWDGNSPVCVSACSIPSIPNGELLLEDGKAANKTMFAVNQRLYLSCNTGYTSVHRVPILTCMNNSQWTGTAVCNRKTTENVVSVSTAAAIGGILGTTTVVAIVIFVVILVVRERKHSRLRVQKKEEIPGYTNLQLPQSSNDNEYEKITETSAQCYKTAYGNLSQISSI